MNIHWHKEARELRASGEKISVIAKRLNHCTRHVATVVRNIVCPIDHRSIAVRKNAVKAWKANKLASRWTPDDDAFLFENYGSMTASEIGRYLDCSKGSVIGRAYRLGLSQKVQL